MGGDVDADFARLEEGGQAQQPSASSRLAAALPKEVLTLDTLDPEPRFVRVDGVSHRISHYDDFSLVQHGRFARLQGRATELSKVAIGADADELSAEEEERLSAALDGVYGDIVRLVLPTLPPEALKRMSFEQKRQVSQAFLTTQAEKNARLAAARAQRPTGGTSSRRSARSTATGATGKSKRRSATSKPPTATSPASAPSTP